MAKTLTADGDVVAGAEAVSVTEDRRVHVQGESVGDALTDVVLDAAIAGGPSNASGIATKEKRGAIPTRRKNN